MHQWLSFIREKISFKFRFGKAVGNKDVEKLKQKWMSRLVSVRTITAHGCEKGARIVVIETSQSLLTRSPYFFKL